MSSRTPHALHSSSTVSARGLIISVLTRLEINGTGGRASALTGRTSASSPAIVKGAIGGHQQVYFLFFIILINFCAARYTTIR